MKSTIRHIVAIDKRDDKIFPTVGNLIKFTSEVAGKFSNKDYGNI